MGSSPVASKCPLMGGGRERGRGGGENGGRGRSRVLHASRAITAPATLKPAARFGTSAEFWMNLQTAHDLEQARLVFGRVT